VTAYSGSAAQQALVSSGIQTTEGRLTEGGRMLYSGLGCYSCLTQLSPGAEGGQHAGAALRDER
jgi:hypothetical protein